MWSYIRKIWFYILNCHIVRVIITEIRYSIVGFRGVLSDRANRKYNKCDLTDNTGKCALVTGGARGIGTAIVKKLLQCDMHVIIACRSIEAGENCVKRIRDSGITSGSHKVIKLDLNSFQSVRECAKEVGILYSKLDILVNNAGIMFPPFKMTEDGFESQWCVNYLSPFLLTHLLMPLIVKSSTTSNARIINVSSCAHYLASVKQFINFDNINDESKFVTGEIYAMSKAAEIMFTIHLSKILKERKLDISVFVVHPGIVDSDLFNGQTIKTLAPWLLNFFKNLDEGATSVVYACISKELNGKSGLYLSNCRGQKPSYVTRKSSLQESLYSYSLLATKCKSLVDGDIE